MGDDERGKASSRFVDVRSYRLKPGMGAEFGRLVVSESAPLLRRHGIDVIAYGPSVHDRDAHYLLRAYASLEELERSEAAFYESDEWRLGPRASIMDCIDYYVSVVLDLDVGSIEGLRRLAITPR
jgi:hypothetical protein